MHAFRDWTKRQGPCETVSSPPFSLECENSITVLVSATCPFFTSSSRIRCAPRPKHFNSRSHVRMVPRLRVSFLKGHLFAHLEFFIKSAFITRLCSICSFIRQVSHLRNPLSMPEYDWNPPQFWHLKVWNSFFGFLNLGNLC